MSRVFLNIEKLHIYIGVFSNNTIWTPMAQFSKLVSWELVRNDLPSCLEGAINAIPLAIATHFIT